MSLLFGEGDTPLLLGVDESSCQEGWKQSGASHSAAMKLDRHKGRRIVQSPKNSTANKIKVGKYISLDPCELIHKTTFVVCSSALKKRRQCEAGLRSTWRILPAVLLSPCMNIILLRSKQTQSQCYQQNITTHPSSDACSFLKTRL